MKLVEKIKAITQNARNNQMKEAETWLNSFFPKLVETLEAKAEEGYDYYDAPKIYDPVRFKLLVKRLRKEGFAVDERPRDLRVFRIHW